jgi:hypothetical protein
MTQLMQALAWTLLHFCWQAAAVAALFGGLNAMTARRSSNTRYLLALGALLSGNVCLRAERRCGLWTGCRKRWRSLQVLARYHAGLGFRAA